MAHQFSRVTSRQRSPGSRETAGTKGRTEFSYGSFVRSVALPTSANQNDIAATYDK
ncbi:Hsp20 family protein [Nocardia gipuzkoensis]|uniref:Hsp20 family protein n=1 Tax=Nocardia gipuzkoensis TaxID=2749991 RepID=UPI003EE1CC51